ncbi:unnamed protein product [Miscanthus lutarioriparius]|uniref:Uncharacterized protein n=1 Tax=Miscanthus lutarioriparius TaxID=422564 RepID=A0A811Q8V7_9POAL|nr:unnamed protein product [Miscanthus lutarioriparius]
MAIYDGFRGFCDGNKLSWINRIFVVEFAEANKINSGLLTNSIDLDEEDALPVDLWIQFYGPEPEDPNKPHQIGHPRGLRHHPALINKIARVTFLPKGLHSDIDTLSAQLGSLSTQEQCQQIQNRQDLIEHCVDVLNNNFNAFSDHFSMIYPRPVPPPAQFLY